MRRHWFFDLDGTLADTDGDIRLAWKAALADLGLVAERFDERFVAGPPIDEMLRTFFPDRCTEALVARMREAFGRHYDGDGFPLTREYPGVLDRVRALRAAGASVYIATNKRWAGTRALADRFGWWGDFDGLYAGDMFLDDPTIGKMRKPALLRYVMARVGARPEACVMVGDTANDFEAARENGLASVAVAWGYGKPSELALADRIARTPEEI